MEHTVNKLLSMEKSLRERLNQLNTLKGESSKRTLWFDAGKENKIEEPTYAIKAVDKKITKINRALFEINHKVKETNAKTVVDIDINYDDLVSELE